MKKILLFVSLMLLSLPIFAKAVTYNRINISAVFITDADVSNINRICANYSTSVVGYKTTNFVTLHRDNNFSQVIELEKPVNEANFINGYGITVDDHIDRYGFLIITGETIYDEKNRTIDIVISVDYDSMGFDGQNYRGNAPLTDKELEERKNGEKPKEIGNTNTTKKTTTTSAVFTTSDVVVTDVHNTTSTINNNNDNQKKETKKKDNSRSLKILIIIGIVLMCLIVVFMVVTVIRIYVVNKRV